MGRGVRLAGPGALRRRLGAASRPPPGGAGPPFEPYGVTVGHGLEWSRLVLQVRAARGDGAPDWMLPAAEGLFDRAVADGWDADGAEGFVYTTDWDGSPVVRDRMHWVVAEAICAAAALAPGHRPSGVRRLVPPVLGPRHPPLRRPRERLLAAPAGRRPAARRLRLARTARPLPLAARRPAAPVAAEPERWPRPRRADQGTTSTVVQFGHVVAHRHLRSRL